MWHRARQNITLMSCEGLDITAHKKCPLESKKSLHFSCQNPAVTKWNPCKEMVIMTLAPIHCWIHSNWVKGFSSFYNLSKKKFQNVRKNQLPFGQNVRYWFWSSWITATCISMETWRKLSKNYHLALLLNMSSGLVIVEEFFRLLE